MPTLSNEDLQAINMLEQATGAKAIDVMMAEDAVYFVVEKGDVGKAIGKQGANIEKLRKVFGRNVELTENADTPSEFIANLFKPAVLKEVKENERDGRRTVHITVEDKDKGLAIGRGGSRIKKARLLCKRKFGIDDVKIA